VLVPEPEHPGFTSFLRSRSLRAPPVLVLIPRRWSDARGVTEPNVVGGNVEILFLDDMLPIEDVTPKPVRNHQRAKREPRSATVSSPPALPTSSDAVQPFCLCVERGGRREITYREYTAICTSARYTLLIDATLRVPGKGYRTRRRDHEGTILESFLTKHELTAVLALVERRAPLGAEDLRMVNVRAWRKLIESARRKIDVQTARRAWRSIATVLASSSRGARYHFNPPRGLTYVVLSPLPGEPCSQGEEVP